MRLRVFGFTIWFLVYVAGAQAQTSSFTYQGRLTDGSTAANGNYDLQFKLFDSLSGGTQISSTQTLNTVSVSNGVFTVALDFGTNAFNGSNRFLEISTRPSGTAAFTVLSPRQAITSTPYAVRSLNAASADSVPNTGLSPGSGNYIQNTASPQALSSFNISGNGTAGGILSGNVVNAATQFNIGGNRILSISQPFNLFVGKNAGISNITGFQNSFFGESAGQANTDGSNNAFFGNSAGSLNTSGGNNAFFGSSAGSQNSTGTANSFFGHGAGSAIVAGVRNTFIGVSAGGFVGTSDGNDNTLLGSGTFVSAGVNSATAIGVNARVDASNSLVLGTVIGSGTKVGIGTTTPTAKLSLVATGDGARILQLGIERAWVFKQFSTGASTALELTADDANNNNKNFLINTQGNVGIGTQGPLDKLHVIGDMRVGVFGTNGCLKNNNGGTIVGTCSSDLRFKQKLVPFGPVLQSLTRLQPKYFFWRAQEFPEKNFGVAREAGLIAQEVERVLPELVSEDEQGYKLVDYSKLPLMLLQAVKEQQSLIQTQQQQIDGLKKLICRKHRRAAVCR